MEPTNKPPVKSGFRWRDWFSKDADQEGTATDFLPDADEIERSPMPGYARITVHVMVAALVLSILWASFSQVEQVVIAHGRMVTPLPNIVLQPLETAIIQKIHVRVGQVVKKGEVLATLDPTFANADQAQLRTRLKSLETQSRGLSAEIDGARTQGSAADADSRLQARLSAERQANYQAQVRKMDETLERLRASLETNRKDQAILQTRVKALMEIETMQEKLVAQNYTSRAAFLSAQEKRLEVDRDLTQSKNREQELTREIAASEAEKSAFIKGWRQKMMEDLLATTRERDGLSEQLQKADKRSNLVTLVAPVDAVVLEMAKLAEGSIVREAETFFTLVPLAAELEAEVQIDAIDVGYVRPSDLAHLKVDAFPFQKHGTIQGKIRTLSEDSFQRNKAGEGGVDSYYLARISFGEHKLKKLPERTRLLPGMTVSAEIVVGHRTVMSYLLWPLTKALDEAIREP